VEPKQLCCHPDLVVAHVIPGRVRLRWRGGGDLPGALVERLTAMPDVRWLEYHPASRSLVVHTEDFVPACRPSSPALVPDRVASADPGGAGRSRSAAWERSLAAIDVDALVAVSLVATWLADFFAGRTVRMVTLPLLVLAGIAGYRFYERRQRAAEREVDDASSLMLLAAQ